MRFEPNVLGAECFAEFCGLLLFSIVEMKGILIAQGCANFKLLSSALFGEGRFEF